MIMTNVVDSQNLLPTQRAAYFHSLRVHLQICQWSTLNLRCLNPLDWGWERVGITLHPIKTDMAPAPEFLLKVIRCNCKTKNKNPCAGIKCSCRKNGLHCVAACGDCRGRDCNNASSKVDQAEFTEQLDDIDDGNIFDIFDEF